MPEQWVFFFHLISVAVFIIAVEGGFLKNLEKPMETQSVTRKKEASAD